MARAAIRKLKNVSKYEEIRALTAAEPEMARMLETVRTQCSQVGGHLKITILPKTLVIGWISHCRSSTPHADMTLTQKHANPRFATRSSKVSLCKKTVHDMSSNVVRIRTHTIRFAVGLGIKPD